MLRDTAGPSLLLLIVASLITAACGGSNATSQSATNAGGESANPTNLAASLDVDDDNVAIIGEADYAPLYLSLEDLTRVHPMLIVGRVESVLLPFNPKPGYQGVPLDDVLDGPSPKSSWTPSPEELNRPPGRSFTVYSITITQVLRGSVRAGETIAILQPGGEFEGVKYQIGGDPVVEVGAEYVFFLDEYEGLKEISINEAWGVTYSGPPYGRFTIQAGTLKAVSPEWLCEPCKAPRALVDRSLTEVQSRVKMAAEGSLGSVELAPGVIPAVPSPVLPTVAAEVDEQGRPTIAAEPVPAVAPTTPPSAYPKAED